MVQLGLGDARRPCGRGGWRPGAERPRGRTCVAHERRVRFAAHFPLHVTLRLKHDVLETPTETRNAIRYVLSNQRAHEARRGERLNRDWIDPFSSAYWFDGWKQPVRQREPRQRELLNVPQPTAAPTVWLLTTGWRPWGPLGFDELGAAEVRSLGGPSPASLRPRRLRRAGRPPATDWLASRRVRRAGGGGGARAEPLGDPLHVRLEVAGHRDVERARPLGGAVLEVVCAASGRDHQRPLRGVDPRAAQEEAHRPLDHEEDVVFLVAVGAGAARVRLEPPLRDRVPPARLASVRLEHRAERPHRVRPPRPWSHHDRLTLLLCRHRPEYYPSTAR